MDGNVLGLLAAVNTLCEGTSWRIFPERAPGNKRCDLRRRSKKTRPARRQS